MGRKIGPMRPRGPTSRDEIGIKAMRSMGTVLWGTAEYPSLAFGSSTGFEAGPAKTT